MFRVISETIVLDELITFVGGPEAGAIASFVGTARNHNEGREVISLEYEGYPEMAELELRRLGAEAKVQWNLCGMAIVHRVGPVKIGEASVMIAVSAGHREDAFAACRFAIEEIKKRVPIWKKEFFVGGEVWIGTQSGQPLSPTERK